MHRYRGFTLIELLVVLVLTAIIVGFAVPSFTTLIDNSRLTSAANDYVGFLNVARAQAIQQGRLVRITPLDGTNWSSGTVAWIDQDGDPSTVEGILRQVNMANSGVSVTGSGVTGFKANGLERNGSAVTFTFCDSRTGETGRQVEISAGGRIATTEVTCS